MLGIVRGALAEGKEDFVKAIYVDDGQDICSRRDWAWMAEMAEMEDATCRA